jgi:hypothetical protein
MLVSTAAATAAAAASNYTGPNKRPCHLCRCVAVRPSSGGHLPLLAQPSHQLIGGGRQGRANTGMCVCVGGGWIVSLLTCVSTMCHVCHVCDLSLLAQPPDQLICGGGQGRANTGGWGGVNIRFVLTPVCHVGSLQFCATPSLSHWWGQSRNRPIQVGNGSFSLVKTQV